jgi:hypothetical protein
VTTDRRCPACGSLVRPDAGWCSLCHADLRTDEEKAAARPAPEWVETAGSPEHSDEATVPDWATELAAVAPEPRGRHARPAGGSEPDVPAAAVAGPATSGLALSPAAADVDAALAKAGVDVQSMLSLLAAGEPDPLAPLTGRLASKGSRAVAATAATVALLAIGILAMFALGSFVH